MDKRCQDKLGHAKRDLKALSAEVARLKDLNARLVRQCAELQADNAEYKRAHRGAFEVLRDTEMRRVV